MCIGCSHHEKRHVYIHSPADMCLNLFSQSHCASSVKTVSTPVTVRMMQCVTSTMEVVPTAVMTETYDNPEITGTQAPGLDTDVR